LKTNNVQSADSSSLLGAQAALRVAGRPSRRPPPNILNSDDCHGLEERARRALKGRFGVKSHWNRHPRLFHCPLPATDIKLSTMSTNPPFRMIDWGERCLREDTSRKFGVSRARNSKHAWLQCFLYGIKLPAWLSPYLQTAAFSQAIWWWRNK
jgi:hypothetical protein